MLSPCPAPLSTWVLTMLPSVGRRGRRIGVGTLSGLGRARSWELRAGTQLIPPPFSALVLVSFPLPTICQSVINSSKKILFPASKWHVLSATPQNTSLMFSRGWGRGNKIAYLPKAMFSELKSIDSPWGSLLFPSEWIFKFGTQVALRLNCRRLPL